MLTQSKKIQLLKFFRVTITYFPILAVICNTFGLICYYFQFPKSPTCYDLAYLIQYLSGGSVLTYIVLYLASKILGISRWNRILIAGIASCFMIQACINEFYNNPDNKGDIMVKSYFLFYGLLILVSLGWWLFERKRSKSQKFKLKQVKNLLSDMECCSCDTINDKNKSQTVRMFILFLKYTPVITFIVMIWNNIVYVANSSVVLLAYFAYFTGIGTFILIIFFIASYLFEFCNWYRALLVGALLNTTVGIVDYVFFYTYDSAYIPILSLLILFIAMLVSMVYKFVLHR